MFFCLLAAQTTKQISVVEEKIYFENNAIIRCCSAAGRHRSTNLVLQMSVWYRPKQTSQHHVINIFFSHKIKNGDAIMIIPTNCEPYRNRCIC